MDLGARWRRWDDHVPPYEAVFRSLERLTSYRDDSFFFFYVDSGVLRVSVGSAEGEREGRLAAPAGRAEGAGRRILMEQRRTKKIEESVTSARGAR